MNSGYVIQLLEHPRASLRGKARAAIGDVVITDPVSAADRSLTRMLNAINRDRTALNAILTGEQFHLVYQPIVCLADRRLQHYEALLRLSPSPDGTVADTGDFAIQIELLGLSMVLDLAVVTRTLAVMRNYSDVRVAVNISGASLDSIAFRDAMLDLVPRRTKLILEVTETAEITNMAVAAKTLGLLRDRGAHVCIDDFGTGHATFRYLRDLPVDCLKIDGSYVHAAPNSARYREVIAAMCAMAGAFNVKTVAEQVESDEQAQLMMELGVTHGQGWLLGRPQKSPE